VARKSGISIMYIIGETAAYQQIIAAIMAAWQQLAKKNMWYQSCARRKIISGSAGGVIIMA